jgi:hypothetical protein
VQPPWQTRVDFRLVHAINKYSLHTPPGMHSRPAEQQSNWRLLKEADMLLDYRSCPSCDPAIQAGQSVTSVANEKDHVACINIRREGMAKMRVKKRPYDLQNQACSL